MAVPVPAGKCFFFNTDGSPLAGGQVYMYVPGTTTAKTTWMDTLQTMPNANPVALDIGGGAVIYGSGQYRQVVVDANGVQLWDEVTTTVDPEGTYFGTGAALP